MKNCNVVRFQPKISSVLPQPDGSHTAKESRWLVEIILLIALVLEACSQMWKREAKTKRLTPRNPIEKQHLEKEYCNKKNYKENLS